MRTSKLVSGIAAGLLALSLSSFAHAGATVMLLSGNSVFASFQTFDASGCIETDVSVVASALVTHDPPGPAEQAAPLTTLVMVRSNLCTREFVVLSGSAPVAPTVSSDLKSATLSATVPMTDGASFSTTMTGRLDVRRDR